MPRGNGTGPQGQGHMTCKGMGLCATERKQCFGRKKCLGSGHRLRCNFRNFGFGANQVQKKDDELSGLKTQAEFLEETLTSIKTKISELEKEEE